MATQVDRRQPTAEGCADDRVLSRSVRWRRVQKRAFDAALSAALLVAMLPVIVVVALAIKLDSRGPIFYRVRRIGYRGRLFHMTKFRKMHVDATGGPLTTAADPRLTRVGGLLTRTKLDELPQLWDVLRGRMSIVGPRPEDPRFVAMHAGKYERILSVRPGITGISQLAFAEEAKILDAKDPIGHYIDRILPQKVKLDTMYVRNHRLSLDFAVLRWTLVATILRRPVAVDRSNARMRVRLRPASAPEALVAHTPPRAAATGSVERAIVLTSAAATSGPGITATSSSRG